MKTSSSLKVVAFMLLFFLSSNLYASKYILNDDGLIDKRAVGKIEEIGDEVHLKLGANIYVYVKSSLGLRHNISMEDKIKYEKTYEKQISQTLEKPYVLLLVAVADTHVNLIVSPKLKKIVNKDDILDGYVVPLLASKDKNSTFSKLSAAVLNGYAAIADIIAESKNIKLKSSIGSEGKTAGTIWRVFIYTLVVLSLVLYTFAMLRRKKSLGTP